MKKIKIAQIGILHAHGPLQLRSILKQKDIFEFVGLYPDYHNQEEMDKGNMSAKQVEDALKRLEENFGNIPILTLDELLNTPGLEAVAVESYEMDLVRYALMAAQRDLHVFMDKPGGESRADFKKWMAVAKEKKLAAYLGYMYRQNPAVKELFKIIQSGEIGQVTCVEAHMDCDHNTRNRNWLGNFQGGMLYFLGCHLIDLIYRIQGRPKRIVPMNTCTHLDGVHAKDYGMVMMEYDTGWSFAKTSAAEFGGFMRRQLVVTGTEGAVEIKPLEYVGEGGQCTDMRIVTRERDGEKGWSAFGEEKTFGPVDRYDGMFQEFAQIIRGEKENPYSYDYEEELFDLVMDCCEIE